MPTYRYKCPACQYRFEVKQGILEEHKAACPECGQIAWLLPSWEGELMMNGRHAVKSSWRKTWI